MYCNCNTANPICDPCSICTPPGVTGLTTCKPPDPCEGVKLDISCIQYSGIDYSCIGVNNGDGLIDVLLKILALYIPQSKCCELAGTGVITRCGLAGTINYYIAPTTTTTSTSTTTTTTIAPSCSYKQLTNIATQPSVVSYVPCNSTSYIQISIATSVMICVNNSYPINVISGSINQSIGSTCNTPAPPTTTSTTTLAPCTCNVYTVYNSNLGSNITIIYTQCGIPNFQTSLRVIAGATVTVCACADILNNTQSGLVISPAGASCTGAITTSTTSTTTTIIPINSLEVCRGDGSLNACACMGGIVTVYYTGTFGAGTVLYSDETLTTYYYNAGMPDIAYAGNAYLVAGPGVPITLTHHC